MDLYSEFNEDDSTVTIPLSSSIATVAEHIFAPSIEIGAKTFTRRCISALKLTTNELAALLQLLEECIGDFYLKHKGRGWNELKAEEMLDPALIYVWYEDGPDIACFVSFRMVNELYGKSLYLYEIHVRPIYQKNKIGGKLISAFHALATHLNVLASQYSRDLASSTESDINKYKDIMPKLLDLPHVNHFSVAGTGLTVFSDNTRALKWYLGLGYVFSNDSPIDRTLRKGVVKKPEYYILYRTTSKSV